MPAKVTNAANLPWVVVFTDFPSPYQVDLFNEVSRCDALLITVVYNLFETSTRLWKDVALSHSHMRLSDCASSDLHSMVEGADLIVFGWYRDAQIRRLMRAREATGKPWVFWGERMGFHLPLCLGALLRKLELRVLHRSSAGMWGIGKLAVEQYLNEFGKNRVYTNLPYTSNLSNYLSIERKVAPQRPLRLLFSGSLIPRKGFDRMLVAFERLLTEGADVQLVIVGHGPLDSDAAMLAARHKGRVECLGFVQPHELPAIYGGCDVLCAPSRHDGWGLIVVEGLAAAIPVISTPATGAAVDLLDETCGWLVAPGDETALHNALKAAAYMPSAKRLAMGTVGRERARAYDRKPGAERFLAACRQALGS